MNQANVDAFLKNLQDRAQSLEEKGNKLGAAYEAAILGMWVHTLKQNSKNPFNGDSVCGSWFITGFECSRQGTLSDTAMRRRYEKYEEQQEVMRKKKK